MSDILNKMRKAIEQIDIWDAAEIQAEYKKETAGIVDVPMTAPCTLEELIVWFENYNLDDDKESVPKKERKEYSHNSGSIPAWINECMPQTGFTMRYQRGYMLALIQFLLDHPRAHIFSSVSFSQSGFQFSGLLIAFYNFMRNADCAAWRISKLLPEIMDRISQAVQSITTEQQHKIEDLLELTLYQDILFLLLSVQDCTMYHTVAENKGEAYRYILYYLAKSISFQNLDIVFSCIKKGFALSNPADRQTAFDILGKGAIKTIECKQLAYDTYLSWIEKKPEGQLKELCPRDYSFGQDEDDWRANKENAHRVATMYNQFAHVCDSIARTYERLSSERKRFQEIAKIHLEEAMGYNATADIQWFYCQVLADLDTPDHVSQEILEQYGNAMKKAEDLGDQLSVTGLYCDAIIDNLLARLIVSKQSFPNWKQHKGIEEYEEWKKIILKYKTLINTAQEQGIVPEKDTQNAWKSFFEVQAYIHTENKNNLKLSLLLIYRLAKHLQKYLRRNAYSSINYYTRDNRKDVRVNKERDPGNPIAYYTTLKTAMYLFSVLYRPNSDVAPMTVSKGEAGYSEGLNCLTMMQAYYMNDPYEGLSFEKAVSGKDPSKNILFYRGNAWHFREDIFQKNFVFLKSFTDRMDNLLMWNRYGSDRETGSRDSNGCCIQFDSTFFDRVNDIELADNKTYLDQNDDYGLYRVVYLNQEGEIKDSKNPKLNKYAKQCYSQIRALLQYVNNELCKIADTYPNDPQISAVRNYVQTVLNPVIFLFKDDEYADEREYRLVVSRSHEELDKIRMLPGEPEKACINPYFQVCINKVILGPNVEQPEYWFNHFRYHIATMWRRALGPGKDIPDFTVEKSNIHYHT